MWVSGITQGLMLSATKESGSVLAYPNFLDAVTSTRWLMHLRAFGGLLYMGGFVLMAWNVLKTIHGAEKSDGYMDVVSSPHSDLQLSLRRGLFNPPVLYSLSLIFCLMGWGALDGLPSGLCLWGAITTVLAALLHKDLTGTRWADWYDLLLANALPFSVLTTVAVLIGGVAQILPTILLSTEHLTQGGAQEPYSPLQLYGRDLYIKEGCYNCHSQMIRTLAGDVLRYGPYSKAGESAYDHPFQWGSKRTGPDLARVGGKYPNVWHLHHMRDPRQISPGSTMPTYPWLLSEKADWEVLPERIRVQKRLGVPYKYGSDAEMLAEVKAEAEGIAADLKTAGAPVEADREIVAMIAYLQRLGKATSHPVAPAAQAGAPAPAGQTSAETPVGQPEAALSGATKPTTPQAASNP
jgi:cytochrome c oxidase cbb3-type subunit I/II